MLTQLRSQRSQRHRQIRRNELDLNGSIWLARVMKDRRTGQMRSRGKIAELARSMRSALLLCWLADRLRQPAVQEARGAALTRLRRRTRAVRTACRVRRS